MSKDWVKDIEEMHTHFNVYDRLKNLSRTELLNFLYFRISCITEEVNETSDAVLAEDPEEVVDGLIDILVFTIGTLDLFGINAYTAWDEVLKANMNKEPGIKDGRSNPFGFPDLIKNPDWRPPNHINNHGKLSLTFKDNDS